jgi:uncharacterized membrane protein
MIGLGLLGLVKGDFTPVWAPVPKGTPARELLVYLCAAISLACGAGLLWRRTAALAARLLVASLGVWLLLFRASNLVLAPTSQDSWSGLGETAVIVAGAWVLYARFATDGEKRRLPFATGTTGPRLARALFALAMIIFGEAHFRYLEETASLVPGWLPWTLAWAIFTGGAYVAAGAAMLIGVGARLAATLATVQMGLFTLLVWLPVVSAGHASAFQWSETIISWALTAAAWVMADSYSGAPWFSRQPDRKLKPQARSGYRRGG